MTASNSSGSRAGKVERKMEYPLQRNFMASVRLSCLHQLFVQRQGYLIHPTIAAATALGGQNTNLVKSDATGTPSSLAKRSEEPVRILDLASGNGIWVMDVARTYTRPTIPAVEVTGLDISLEQAPPPSLWPKHVKFDTYNVFDEVPEVYQHHFDIIHMQLLTSIVRTAAQRQRVFQNLATFLKPGGWIQWLEAPVDSCWQVRVEQDGSIRRRSEYVHPFFHLLRAYVPDYMEASWQNELDGYLSRSGLFTVIDVSDPLPQKWMLKYETEAFLQTVVESAPYCLKAAKDHGGEAEEQEVQAVLDSTLQECAAGENWMSMRSLIVIAQKVEG